MKSGNITVTNGRLLRALNNANETARKTSTTRIKENYESISIHTGTLTKFYYNWDRAEVKLNNQEKEVVLCRLTHPVSMGCKFFWTPFGDLKYDEERQHTYFAPAASNYRCLVLTIKDEGSFVIAYYYNEKIGSPPNIAEGGVVHIAGYDESIQLGGVQEGGIILDAPNIIFKDWIAGDQRNVVPSANMTDDNILSKDYYSKEEVDSLLQELRDEFNTKLEEEEDDGSTS